MRVIEKLSEILKDGGINHYVKNDTIIIPSNIKIQKDNGVYAILMGNMLLKANVTIESREDQKYNIQIKLELIKGPIEEDYESIIAYRIMNWLRNSGYIQTKDLIMDT